MNGGQVELSAFTMFRRGWTAANICTAVYAFLAIQAEGHESVYFAGSPLIFLHRIFQGIFLYFLENDLSDVRIQNTSHADAVVGHIRQFLLDMFHGVLRFIPHLLKMISLRPWTISPTGREIPLRQRD